MLLDVLAAGRGAGVRVAGHVDGEPGRPGAVGRPRRRWRGGTRPRSRSSRLRVPAPVRVARRRDRRRRPRRSDTGSGRWRRSRSRTARPSTRSTRSGRRPRSCATPIERSPTSRSTSCRSRSAGPQPAAVDRAERRARRPVHVPRQLRPPQRDGAQAPARRDRGVRARLPRRATSRCGCSIKTLNGEARPRQHGVAASVPRLRDRADRRGRRAHDGRPAHGADRARRCLRVAAPQRGSRPAAGGGDVARHAGHRLAVLGHARPHGRPLGRADRRRADPGPQHRRCLPARRRAGPTPTSTRRRRRCGDSSTTPERCGGDRRGRAAPRREADADIARAAAGSSPTCSATVVPRRPSRAPRSRRSLAWRPMTDGPPTVGARPAARRRATDVTAAVARAATAPVRNFFNQHFEMVKHEVRTHTGDRVYLAQPDPRARGDGRGDQPAPGPHHRPAARGLAALSARIAELERLIERLTEVVAAATARALRRSAHDRVRPPGAAERRQRRARHRPLRHRGRHGDGRRRARRRRPVPLERPVPATPARMRRRSASATGCVPSPRCAASRSTCST